MFSSFLSNFENFINATELEVLENIAGYKLVKGLDPDTQPKLQFMNQGVNSKELILFFLLKTMKDAKEHFFDFKNDVTKELIDLFKRYSHLRIKWESDSSDKKIHANLNFGDKRQLSVKMRGTYYTPNFMSDFMSKESLDIIIKQKRDSLDNIIQEVNGNSSASIFDKLTNILPIRIVDLSMGIGNFLCDVIPYLLDYLQNIKKIIQTTLLPLLSNTNKESISNSFPFCLTNSEQETFSDFADFIINKCLYGIELDPKICKMAKIIVSLKIQFLTRTQIELSPNLICRNSIITILKPQKNPDIVKKIKELNGFVFSEQFPEVFNNENSGFDLIIGNPPWEILKPNNREFFTNYQDNFMQLDRTKQDENQSKLLNNKAIQVVFQEYTRKITSQLHVISSLDYINQSSLIKGKTFTGDPQLFKFFMENAFNVVKNKGIISLIVQHNILGSKSCANLRKLYVNNGESFKIWEFYNRNQNGLYFKNVDPNQRFILFQFQKKINQKTDINYKKCDSAKDLNCDFLPYQKVNPELYYKVSNEELQLFGFENEEHRNVFEKILASNNDFSNFKWMNKDLQVNFSQEIHVTRNRDMFSENPTSSSVYGGRSFGPYYFQDIKPRYLKESATRNFSLPENSIVCRNILPNSAKRIIFSIPPSEALLDNSCTRVFLEKEEDNALHFLLAISNSLLVEFYLRTILTGMNLNYYLIRRIPIPSQTSLNGSNFTELLSNLIELVIELPKTPLETNEWAIKFAKIEAIIALLFKLSQKEVEVILDNFDFIKLQKTKFCGSKPFANLTKKLILDYFISLISRFT